MSLDEMLRERIGALTPPVEGEPAQVLERVVAGGKRRRTRARLVVTASVAAALVLIGAATLSLTGDPSAQVDFVGPVPADADRAALPDCGRPDLRTAADPQLSSDGKVLVFLDILPMQSGPSTTWLGEIVICDASGGVRRLLGRDGPVVATRIGISPNGRFLVFDSAEDGIVRGDADGRLDVFVADLSATDIVLASPSRTGDETDGDNYAGSVSDDGRWVAFLSTEGLTKQRGSSGVNAFLHDLASGRTTMITPAKAGGLESRNPFRKFSDARTALSMAGDGRVVINSSDGVYLHDGPRGTMRRIRAGLPAKISSDGEVILQPERVVTPDLDPPPRVRILDLSDGSQDLVPFGPRDPALSVTINDAALSATGRFVVASTLVQPGATRQPDGAFVTELGADDGFPTGSLIIRNRTTGSSTELIARVVARDLSVSADGGIVAATVFVPHGDGRRLGGIVLIDVGSGRVVQVSYNPPWHEGRALALTLYGAALLTLLALYQVWRLYRSPLRADEAKQLAILVLVVAGSAGWIWAASGRTAGTPLIVLGVPVVVAWLLRPHRWRFARARTRLRRNAA